MSTDLRALCAELTEALCGYEVTGNDFHLIRRARAVLARYAHQPAPVPVAERLPGPEDCDGEGRCWFWQTGTDSAGNWGNWELCAPCYFPSHYPLHGITHWLPATALPLPAGEVE